jgi:hypothetical protein
VLIENGIAISMDGKGAWRDISPLSPTRSNNSPLIKLGCCDE